MVKRVVEEEMPEKGAIKIVTTPSNDKRSYHVNSDKIGAGARLQAEAHHRGCRARSRPRLPQLSAAEQL